MYINHQSLDFSVYVINQKNYEKKIMHLEVIKRYIAYE